MSSPQQWPRGPTNDLHCAAFEGSTERTVALLSRNEIDIDQGEPHGGTTALVIAAGHGYSRVVRILLNKGANVAIANKNGFSALHFSAQEGHLSVTKMLVKAKADLEAKTFPHRCTPLHLAAECGRTEVMRWMIEAGANPNSREMDGATPLYRAAVKGRVAAMKVLLRAGANPLLTQTYRSEGDVVKALPLGVAAGNGHVNAVRELIRQVGIEGCGGPSGGLDALNLAARKQHVHVLAALTDAGVVDTGYVLTNSAENGREASLKFLLRQQGGKASDGGAYVNSHYDLCPRPLFYALGFLGMVSPRITRLLVDAGADTTLTEPLRLRGRVVFNDTPLAFVDLLIRQRIVNQQPATDQQLQGLEVIRRLLLRVEAIHAVSWLWASDAPSIAGTAAEETNQSATTSTSLTSMLPLLRRRAGRPRVLLAALFRHSRRT